MEVVREEKAGTRWDGVWIAIPAYQEERTIRALAADALALCPRVIVIDDGSNDGTQAQLQGLPVQLLAHAQNRGKAASLATAFAFALDQQARCVIALDGDGQHDPADAPCLLAAWQRNPDRIVIGSRLHDRSQFPPARYRANKFACFWISWAAGHPIADSQSGFRVYPSEAMRIALAGNVRGSRFTFESEILIEAARRGAATARWLWPYPGATRPRRAPATSVRWSISPRSCSWWPNGCSRAAWPHWAFGEACSSQRSCQGTMVQAP